VYRYSLFLRLFFVCGGWSLSLQQGWCTSADWEKIVHKVWSNECRESVEGLTSWNEGEEFPSLGVGHFIWYPIHYQGPFQEAFADLLLFLKSKEVYLPPWLEAAEGCPWPTREAFLEAKESQEMEQLRLFLFETIALQTEFMVRRLERALPLILAHLEEERRAQIIQQFNRISQEPLGNYALLDYVNFKGEGISSKETYGGKGWGLLQVLEEMSIMNLSELPPLEQFVLAAKKVLAERVLHAPKERKEMRWLQGWYQRLNTYLRRSFPLIEF
jgi:hypothetical protein